MTFAHPTYLYLLFALPVVYGLWYWARMARRRKLRRFGNLEVIAPLMPEASKYTPAIKITLQLLAIAALVIALARPRSGEHDAVESTKGIEVIVAFDVSRSMDASSTDDANGRSRIDQARLLLKKMLDTFDNNRVGLIVFAEDAVLQLPVTNDYVSAKIYLNDLSTGMLRNQGTSIGSAIQMAMNSFSPSEDVSKAIIVITDSEDHDGDAVAMAHEAAEKGIQVDVVGVGSPKGNKIPLDDSGERFLHDYEGNEVVTALNEEMAREIAKAGNGVFLNAANSTSLTDLTDTLAKLQKSNVKNLKYKASAEQFPVFVIIAMILLILDIFVLDRKVGWLKRYNFFSK